MISSIWSAEIVITDARPVMGLDHMNVCPVSHRMPITLIYKPVLCAVKTTKRRGHAASVMVTPGVWLEGGYFYQLPGITSTQDTPTDLKPRLNTVLV